MKKIVTLVAAFAVMCSSFAAVTPSTEAPKNAKEIFIPIGKTGKTISLMELSTISVKDFEAMSGRDLKKVDELGFKMGQKKLRKGIAADGTIKNKQMNKMFAGKMAAGETGFHIGGFALGFFLAGLGVLLAYVAFNDDYKQNRIKWAWIGLGAWVVVWILLWVLVFAAASAASTSAYGYGYY